MKRIKLILPLLMLFSLGFISPQTVDDDEEGYSVGSTVKDFKLRNVDGRMVSLNHFTHARGFIVIFTSNTCPIVKLYEERIIQLHRDFAPLGYPVIAINSNSAEKYPKESLDHMAERHREKKYPFPYLQDKTQEVAKQFGASRTPHTFVLKREEGKMEVVYIGAIDDKVQKPNEVGRQFVREAINRMIRGKRIRKTETRAVGCTIKWKES